MPAMGPVAGAVMLLLVVAACGDHPLQGVGDRASHWIDESEKVAPPLPTVPSTTEPVDLTPVRAAALVTWANDDLAAPTADDPGRVAAAVWDRSTKDDRYVQASRLEIAVAVPGIAFPGVVPDEVEHVTSQLVFSPQDGTLGRDWLAAFGMWSVRPYSQSRAVGQPAVLLVGPAAESGTAPPGASGEGTSDLAGYDGCDRFADRTPRVCAETAVGDLPAWSLEDDTGFTLVWVQGGYRYELFYRPLVDEVVIHMMAEDMVPLTEIEQGGSVASVAEGGTVAGG